MEKVESMKIAFISSKLDLSTEEAQKFWPIYNEMNAEMKALSPSTKLDREDFQNLSENEAEKVLETMIDNETKKLEIKKSYAIRMSNVIGAKKVLRLFKSDRQFKQRVLNNMKERSGKRDHKNGDRGLRGK